MTVLGHLELVDDLLYFPSISSPPRYQDEQDRAANEDADSHADRKPNVSSSGRFNFLLKALDNLQVFVVNPLEKWYAQLGIVADYIKQRGCSQTLCFLYGFTLVDVFGAVDESHSLEHN